LQIKCTCYLHVERNNKGVSRINEGYKMGEERCRKSFLRMLLEV
jgi:hypothetical protein